MPTLVIKGKITKGYEHWLEDKVIAPLQDRKTKVQTMKRS